MSEKNKIQEIDWEKERKQVIVDLRDECQSMQGKIDNPTRKYNGFTYVLEEEMKWRKELLNKYNS